MRQFFMFPIFYFDRDRTNSNYMSTPFSMNSLALVKYKDCIVRSLRANVTWVMLLSIKCCSLKIANIAWRLFGIEPMHNHNISCENSRKVRHGNISTATLQTWLCYHSQRENNKTKPKTKTNKKGPGESLPEKKSAATSPFVRIPNNRHTSLLAFTSLFFLWHVPLVPVLT